MCTVPVETGPFYALKIGPTMFNTQGGPRRNQYAQVIGTDGYPIQGLFEGGEMGSVFADMYNGGGNLSETMVFGRFAGQNAAKRAKGEFEGATEKAVTHQEKLDAEAAAAAAESAVDVTAVADGTYEGSGHGLRRQDHRQRDRRGWRHHAPARCVESSETATIGELALPGLLRGDRRDPGRQRHRHRLRALPTPCAASRPPSRTPWPRRKAWP